ncbi:hypothetical protein AMS68_004970 [Peltaster fructicola]|uniref:Methyltransferase domain-containing protein n=1 Tax=Peltaster fructicola TaxID=286661 RepID=A0A6H0XXH1_9PEZI|nr:hypothetical protein AMS68_004970 [Peltaster fructicola]
MVEVHHSTEGGAKEDAHVVTASERPIQTERSRYYHDTQSAAVDTATFSAQVDSSSRKRTALTHEDSSVGLHRDEPVIASSAFDSTQPIYEHLAEEQHLEAEDDDADSALGSDTESTTTTLSESIFNYRREHGRTYHAYKEGRYILPNDEREADRLDLQHHLFYLTFAGKLHFAPINRPNNALDVGTGTGIWAMDFADQFPECQVIGIDLSPGQPTLIPPNLKFVIDDAEDLWVYHNKFDYIHARLMAGSFADWPNFFRQAFELVTTLKMTSPMADSFRNLEPGGWLELQDYGLPVKSADGTHLKTNITKWGELLCEAARKLGRPMGSDACDLYAEQMKAAGFVDIEQRMFMWPSNGWPKDPYMKELGRWNQVNCLDGLEGFCLALLTRALGWARAEVDIFVALTTKDFKDKSIHAYFPMPVTFGRKPKVNEVV